MDRLSKRLLIHMNSRCKNPSEQYYNFWEDLDSMTQTLRTGSETLRADIRYLESMGFLKYGYLNEGDQAVYFYLDHKGLHWREFRKEEILRYLQDKWIDCLSLQISIAALVISGIALWPKGSG